MYLLFQQNNEYLLEVLKKFESCHWERKGKTIHKTRYYNLGLMDKHQNEWQFTY